MKKVLALLGVVSLSVLGCAAETDADTTSGASAVTASVGPVTIDALTPAYWNVDADPNSPTPGSEPINVIVSTNLDLGGPAGIVDALWRETSPRGELPVKWHEVDVGAGFAFVTGLAQGETRCISAEKALIDDGARKGDVTEGLGRDVEEVSMRLAGCAGVVFDGESHARAWRSQKTRVKLTDGTPLTTWYLALSQEHVCSVDVNGKKTPWHCILPVGFQGDKIGIKGKKVTAPTGGYNQGRDEFVADLKRIAEVYRYEIKCQDFERPEGEGLRVPGVPRVTWDTKVTHCSIVSPTVR